MAQERNRANAQQNMPKFMAGVVVALVLLVAGCSCPGDISVCASVLDEQPCAPPCWQGIVPGDSMEKSEIIALVESFPNVSHTWEPVEGSINWTWERWPWEGTGYNNVYLLEGKVHHISLSVNCELTVEEILGKYGIPEATLAILAGIPEEPYIGMTLHYPTQGLEFKARVPYPESVVEPTTRIYNVNYYVPVESLEAWEASWEPGSLQPWPGYGRLEEIMR